MLCRLVFPTNKNANVILYVVHKKLFVEYSAQVAGTYKQLQWSG